MIERWKLIWYWDKYSFILKRNYRFLHEAFFIFFDRPPRRKKDEKLQDYVLRVDKRHALREIHRVLVTTRPINLDYVNARLATMKKGDPGWKIGMIAKQQAELYDMCKFLQEQIRNG